jgi:hypothetical protein
MDWPLAIERHRQALLGIVATIAALLGGGEGAIARGLRRAALALLRPAESAARCLIVIAALGLVARPRAPRPLLQPIPARAGGERRPPAFALFDRAKRYRPAARVVPRGIPRIRSFWAPAMPPLAPPAPPPAVRPDPDALVDGAGLRLRLAALELALADLPHQARRLARRRARQAATPQRPQRQPLRLGRPPGWRSRPDREVDLVLRECHALAQDALRADTS